MSGYKDFTTGQVLTASDVQDYLMDQSVMVFGGTAARGSAIASPTEGMVTYLSDDDKVQVYDGTSWSDVGGVGAAVVSNTPTGTYSSGGTAYAYYEFTASGTLTVNVAGFADVLVVGGGGGGGSASSFGQASGGGAGRYLAYNTYYFAAGTATVTVGAGGARDVTGTNSSLFDPLVAPGGGAGTGPNGNGVTGGSGGGAGGGTVTNVAGKSIGSGSGNNGSVGTQAATAGGGGGANAAGSGATGGAGIANDITGSSVTYAKGGNGGVASPVSGTANSGNGGDGGLNNSSSPLGGAGGSGIVIVRIRTA